MACPTRFWLGHCQSASRELRLGGNGGIVTFQWKGRWTMRKTKRLRRRRCKHCHRDYDPDPRTAKKQKYCGRAECQRARRRLTARAWRRHNHLRHPDDVTRVQVWRETHPGYWRKHRRGLLLLELFIPSAILRLTRFWAKLTQPKTGALQILTLVQRAGKPCVVKELLAALRIPIKKGRCPCYRAAACPDCALGRRETIRCGQRQKRTGPKITALKVKRP
jgi:hypothetical protein